MQLFRQAFLFIVCSILFLPVNYAQKSDTQKWALNHIKQQAKKYGLVESDIAHLRVSNKIYDDKSDVTRFYFVERVNNVDVFNAVWPVMVRSAKKVWSARPSYIKNAASKINTSTTQLDMFAALEKTVIGLGLIYEKPQVLEVRNDGITMLEGASFSNSDVLVRKVYFNVNNTLKLAWQFDIDAKKSTDYWSMIVDAQTGGVLAKKSYTTHCNFDAKTDSECHDDTHKKTHKNPIATQSIAAQKSSSSFEEESSYYVLSRPAESPIHGSLDTLVSPWDPAASPYGWHDIDGVDGAEYTITRGNNVHAYIDLNAENGPNSAFPEPDGGPNLNFVFPIDFLDEPDTYRDAATTNLFYMVNTMHDFTYAYGFDEKSGNFQQNNYGNAGQEGDYVRAEAQDGSGTNNANFSTPSDGGNGRMQMFLWDRSAGNQDLLTVNAPDDISGTYSTGAATFGLPVTADNPISGIIVQALDATGSPTLLCGNLINGEALNGNIAMIDRGTCEFGSKSLKAQNAGAIAVIICNYENTPVGMAGGIDGGSVTIPVVSLSSADCASLKLYIDDGVTVTLQAPATMDAENFDADYDNGIIAHEFAHGISNRLVGGPQLDNCLGNSTDGQGNADGEQMGEGWSDFFTLATCTYPGSEGADKRGIGTYVSREETNGNGIRPYPYSTDMVLNPVTYDYIMGVSVPHGVGSVWCAILWDLYWAMIDEYGWSDDQVYGDAGNNRAIQLVMDGMKHTACGPSFVDGRDGILMADEILYDGANQCLIWEVFARRGVGFSADAGLSSSRFDNTEAYDVPETCITELKVRKSVTANIMPGDDIDVTLVLRNDTDGAATNIVIEDAIEAGQTPKMGSGSIPFTIVGDKVVFNIDNVAAGAQMEITYKMETTASAAFMSSPILVDDIESGDVLFVADFLIGNSPWDYEELAPQYVHSGVQSWVIFGAEARNDQVIMMEDPITLPTGKPILRFWNSYQTEPGADGLVVQVSTDGGTVWDFLPKEAFFRNGYRGRMQGNAFFASDVYAFWAGDNTWQESYADLSAYAGQDVKIRFRFASDDNVASTYVSIDDIEIADMFNYNGDVCVFADGIDAHCYQAEGKGTYVEYNTDIATKDPLPNNLSYNVYPNPNKGTFNVTIDEEGMQNGVLEVYSIEGEILMTKMIGTSTNIDVTLKNIAKGIYFVKIKTSKATGVRKLIIQ